MVLGHQSKKSQNHENPFARIIFMTIFVFFCQFFFHNNVFKLQQVVSEHEIRVFLLSSFRSFQKFVIEQIEDEPEILKRFQKHFWKLDFKPNKPRILWLAENILWSLSEATQYGHFQCYWKIHWGLSQKPDPVDVLGKIQVRST
jgi:hypothetical protein